MSAQFIILYVIIITTLLIVIQASRRGRPFSKLEKVFSIILIVVGVGVFVFMLSRLLSA